jgi:hypothetical protein
LIAPIDSDPASRTPGFVDPVRRNPFPGFGSPSESRAARRFVIFALLAARAFCLFRFFRRFYAAQRRGN